MFLDLTHIIPKIIHGGYTPAELSAFIKFTQNIAFADLKQRQFYGKRICNSRHNLDTQLRDLALDCIAGLFERNDRGEFVLWQRYFNHHLPPGAQPSRTELLILMRRIVLKKVKQELARIFAERRPQEARILRNLRVAAHKHRDVHLFRHHGMEYVSFSNAPKDDTRAPISAAALLHAEETQMEKTDTSIAFIRAMLSVLRRQPEAQQRLPLNLLLKILSAHHTHNLKNHLFAQVEAASVDHYLEEQMLLRVQENVKQRLRTKLEQFQIQNRISAAQRETYYPALVDLLHQIHDKKRPESQRKVLQRHTPNLTPADFRKNERYPFEYLVKLMRRWYKEEAEKMLNG